MHKSVPCGCAATPGTGCCRAQLAQEEAELGGVEAECAAGEVQVRVLSAKYDRAQALLQRDREALAAQQTELEDARTAAAAEAATAAAAAAEAERCHEDLRVQVGTCRTGSGTVTFASLVPCTQTVPCQLTCSNDTAAQSGYAVPLHR